MEKVPEPIKEVAEPIVESVTEPVKVVEPVQEMTKE